MRIVSASCKVQPKRQVNISANTMGRVTRLAVQEGQRVKAGQFLLEIDPRSLEGQLQRGEASVAAARSSLQQARTAVEQARATLELSRQNLKRQEELWKEGLTSRESLERAQNDVAVREAELEGAGAGNPDARRADQAGRGQPLDDALQPEPGHHLVADGRHHHAPQHRGGRERRRRHDEQRRNRPAHRRRHVDHRGRTRGG